MDEELCSTSLKSESINPRIGKEDSGGPLFAYKQDDQNNSIPVLLGIIFNTKEKNKIVYNIYSRVANHNEWTASVILTYGDGDSSPVCDSGVRKMGLFMSDYKRSTCTQRIAWSFVNSYLAKDICVSAFKGALDDTPDDTIRCGNPVGKLKNFFLERTGAAALNSSEIYLDDFEHLSKIFGSMISSKCPNTTLIDDVVFERKWEMFSAKRIHIYWISK